MTVQEVVAAFGTPTNYPQPHASVSTLRYIAPIGSRTADREGYVGFVINFWDGRVSGWRVIRANPSFEPVYRPPAAFKYVWWWWGLLFVGAFLYGSVRAVRMLLDEDRRLLKAFLRMEIPTRRLPVEFRFIDHDTTLADVAARLDIPSRQRIILLNPDDAAGYPFPETKTGLLEMRVLEYELPYGGAVILMPELPFATDSLVRAVYYRRTGLVDPSPG